MRDHIKLSAPILATRGLWRSATIHRAAFERSDCRAYLVLKETLVAVQLNHTIVNSRDARASAAFYSEILGLAPPRTFAHFVIVDTANGVSLDFISTDEPLIIEHYAFLVSEGEFDEIFGRLQARGLDYWADPRASRKSEINRNDGGRGCYFKDPSGHFLEIITRPYGG